MARWLGLVLGMLAATSACGDDQEEMGTQCCALARFCGACSTCSPAERTIGGGKDETACKQVVDQFLADGRYCHGGNEPPRRNIQDDIASCLGAPPVVPGSGGAGGSGGSGGSGGTGPACGVIDCSCSDGTVGECDAAGSPCECTEPCSCLMCPEFQAEFAPEFDACGGSPVGTWRLTELPAEFTTDPARACRALRVDPSQGLDLRIDLTAGGTYELDRPAFSTRASTARECVSSVSECYDTLPSFSTAERAGSYLGVALESCTETPCGLCDCTFEGSALAESGNWVSSGSELQIGPLVAQFCRQGDTLRLRTDEGVFELSRMVGLGRPSRCETRTAETCTGGCSPGGTCVGADPCPTFAYELDCISNAGCSWEAMCVGEPTMCELADYDRAAGCVIQTPDTACVGTVPACELTTPLTEENCAEKFGCYLTDVCTGGLDCGTWTTRANCVLVDGCSWEPRCAGTPTPCEQYPLYDCSSAPGCYLTP